MPTEATTLPSIVDSSTSTPPGPPQGQGLDICDIEIDDGANPVDRHPFRRSTVFLLDNKVRVRVLFYFETNLFFFSRGSPHLTSRSWRPPQSIQAETRLLLGKYRSQAQENCVFLDRLITTIINDRYEFPVQLDLDRENGKYLSPDAIGQFGTSILFIVYLLLVVGCTVDIIMLLFVQLSLINGTSLMMSG
ncbi:ubiquitin carboxyl-terminal hydrolase 12-like [Iris pallida]|uniref:Ubiquitin carboxyl-terminal hydrolase 12-like n=1 Tax=Iris pallida TaxID=29817 RepID=A0AAX6EQ70_IRIPA|nr:ubiquitin carboxyl-terminal hydrolase 12-like [Iris pallida]